MFFYKIDAQIINADDLAIQEEPGNYAGSLQMKTLTLYQGLKDGAIFISSIYGQSLTSREEKAHEVVLLRYYGAQERKIESFTNGR